MYGRRPLESSPLEHCCLLIRSSLLTDAVIEDGQPLRTEAKPEA